jgi:hypothetical protein
VIGAHAADDLLALGLAERIGAVAMSLRTVSFASEPELVKNTLLIGTGASATSFSARSIEGPCDLAEKV